MIYILKHKVAHLLWEAADVLRGNMDAFDEAREGVLVSIDFNIKNKLSDKKLRDLLSHFSRYRLRNGDFERPDLLGTAYEYLTKMFADIAGKNLGTSVPPLDTGSRTKRYS